MLRLRIILVVLLCAGLFLYFTSGSFLIVDAPQKADAIVVLAGETGRRPERGLQLLGEKYAPRMLLDVPASAHIYDKTTLEIAEAYVMKLPQRQFVSVCPVVGLSTKAEVGDVSRCLHGTGTGSILLVTSDFHTRRTLSTFERELPGYRFSVAAAYDPQQFEPSWWQNRQWAKTNFDEWLRLMWWDAVDRWE